MYRQGCYCQDGDIVVLCAYLGQLSRLRDALSNEVVVVIDERDREQLAQHEDDGEGMRNGFSIEQVKVAKRVFSLPSNIIASLTFVLCPVGTTSHSRQLSRRRSKGKLFTRHGVQSLTMS
jgi:hypothetical protein